MISKYVYAFIILVALMLSSLTFIGGFGERYGLNDTRNFTNAQEAEFASISNSVYNYSQDVQNSTMAVTESTGEDSLIAGLWVIPQALTILAQIPWILTTFMTTIVGLGAALAFSLPYWVPGLVTAALILMFMFALAAIIWKWKV